MRIDRARLDKGGFAYRFNIDPRFSDLDKIGHINNVAIAGIFQEGRNRFFRASALYSLAQRDLVVAACTFEYAGDLLYPDTIEVDIGVLEIGRSSFRVAQTAGQNGRIGAYAEVTQVARDASGACALPDVWREKLETLKLA